MQDSCDVSKTSNSLRTGMLTILMLAVTMCFLIMPVTAHAPTNITIAYNPDMHKLSVTVTHPVDDPTIHYVRGVHVKLNGDVISDPTYKSQPYKNTFTYTYDVAAHPGDTIWVIATCVNGQSLEEHYDIPRPASLIMTAQTLPPAAETPPPATTTAPPPTTRTTYAAAGLLHLFGAAAVVFLIRRI